jgi:hypothetical protein
MGWLHGELSIQSLYTLVPTELNIEIGNAPE